jgi:hypothetical protein
VRGTLAQLSQKRQHHTLLLSAVALGPGHDIKLTAKDILPTQLPIPPTQNITVHRRPAPQHHGPPLARARNPQLHAALHGLSDAVRPSERRELEGVGRAAPGGEASLERVCGLEGFGDGAWGGEAVVGDGRGQT